MSEGFDFEIPRIVSTLKQRKCVSILLQFPEGLKRRAMDVASDISGQLPGCDVVVSGEPCFGACDVPVSDAGLIVNFGHLPIPSLETKNSVLFIQARSDADPLPVLEANFDSIPDISGLITTAQHIHVLPDVVEFLGEKGKRAVVGRGDGRIFADGQVLGCNVSSAKSVESTVEGYVFIGTGMFHPLAVALGTGKAVFALDPVSGDFTDIAGLKDRTLRQRHAVMEKAREARSIGIIVSTKPGQRRLSLAKEVRDSVIRSGRKAIIVELEAVTPQKLNAFGLDCWISTLCPRLAIDDAAMYDRPVLTPPELEIVLGIRRWEDYTFDGI